MNPKQIHKFLSRYFEASGCQIIDKTPSHFKVRLSPEADKDLTNRSYYWGFVERTGVTPETMTFQFIVDPEKFKQMNSAEISGLAAQPGSLPQGIYSNNRIPQEEVTYGSRRLHQIFGAAASHGKYVQMYEQKVSKSSQAYTSWLGVNYTVEMTCDMKREELHSLGICLATGEIHVDFLKFLDNRALNPRLPVNTYIPRGGISLHKAVSQLEKHLENKCRQYDNSWASEARERLHFELSRIETYYEDLLSSAEEAIKSEIQEQFENRVQEIEWQYAPRIQVSAVNCGIFHLLPQNN